jgi:nucleoside-diphosphate kinase
LVGEIIQRFERKGFVLVGLKMVQPDKKLVSDHYADLSARPFYNGLVQYMSSSGPVVAMVFQGKGVVKYARVMLVSSDCCICSCDNSVLTCVSINRVKPIH